jgi:hypothetical protein
MADSPFPDALLTIIGVFSKPVTGWQVLPADASDCEESALRG